MPSFDIVSEINRQEVDNAVNQAAKEIATRYDFKGSKSKIILEKEGISLSSDDEFKMKAVVDILQSKLVKRGLNLKSFEFGKAEPGPDGLTKQFAKIIAGISQEKAKDLVKLIKETNSKVQASIQGEQVRVSGRQKDELQTVIATLRSQNFPIPLQFTNYRD